MIRICIETCPHGRCTSNTPSLALSWHQILFSIPALVHSSIIAVPSLSAAGCVPNFSNQRSYRLRRDFSFSFSLFATGKDVDRARSTGHARTIASQRKTRQSLCPAHLGVSTIPTSQITFTDGTECIPSQIQDQWRLVSPLPLLCSSSTLHCAPGTLHFQMM